MRLIGENGEQLGVVSLEEARKKAFALGLDLIQVTEKLEVPVCKIMDYGKYAYQQGKKEKKGRVAQHTNEVKSIRITLGISDHDIETRATAANKFLKQGAKVRINLALRGRENAAALAEFSKTKVAKLLELIKQKNNIIIERPLQREARGFGMIIANDKLYGKNQEGLSKKV